VHLHVVVEVTVHVAAGASRGLPGGRQARPRHLPPATPRVDPLRPVVEGPIVVPARIQFLVAVQPHVHEVGGEVLQQRPAPRRVGDDQRNPVAAQEADEGLVHEARVPDLHRVANPPLAIDGQAGAVLHPAVVPPRHLEGRRGVAREEAEEPIEARLLERQLRGELPEQGPELLPQLEEAGGEEVRQGRLHVLQLEHVGDVARPLHGKHEARRRLTAPRRVELRALEGVERAVQLDRGEHPGRVFQLPAVRETGRVEHAPPALVAPARDADADPAAATCHMVKIAAIGRVLPTRQTPAQHTPARLPNPHFSA